MATMPLEHTVRELDHSEELRRTENKDMRDAIIARQVNETRLRISDLFKLRRSARQALLLPEEIPDEH